MIESMKVACSKAATTLCVELSHRFPNVEIMSTLGIVYSHYWLCEENVIKNFLPHLDKIKATLCDWQENQRWCYSCWVFGFTIA